MIEASPKKVALINDLLENDRFTKQFQTLGIIGRGGFGVVYKVKHYIDGSIYALKKVKLHLGYNESLQNHKVFREIQALRNIDPTNILRYYGCWVAQLDQDEIERENLVVEKIKLINQ